MDILPEDTSAKTLYFRAIRSRSLAAVETLVSLGADVTWRDEDGSPGLHLSTVRQEVDKLEFLLSKGADVNQTDRKGRTALMVACLCGLPAMVERLCQVPGINLNSRDGTRVNCTALLFAVTSLTVSDSLNHLQCVEKLRAVTGVDWDAVDSVFGFSGIMAAVYLGHTGIVETLLPVSNLSLTNTDGDTVAHLAVKSTQAVALRILQLLCQDGRVDWNTLDRKGKSPAMIALELNKVDMFRCLVRTPGVDTDLTDGEGRNLMQLIM